jgi:hypothetical protein
MTPGDLIVFHKDITRLAKLSKSASAIGVRRQPAS